MPVSKRKTTINKTVQTAKKKASKASPKKTAKKKVLKKKITKKKPPVGIGIDSVVPKKEYLKRSKSNPIISPKEESWWENYQTFNSAAILLDEKIHFLYRAIGSDGISRIGYASSEDGKSIKERYSYPAYQHKLKTRVFNIYSFMSGGSWGGAEDPRLVRIGDEETLYLTYTAVGDGELRMAMSSIKMNDFLDKKWKWSHPVFLSPKGQVHKNWVIFPEKINDKYAILHSINPKISIEYVDSLDFDETKTIKSKYGGKIKKTGWDNWIRGAGSPPIKTKHGWLLFYHAMEKTDFSKYKVGAMLLDLDDPSKVLYRSKEPILEPSEYYENNGFKAGVVYVAGSVIKDNKLSVYYGGADTFVCVAEADLNKFIKDLMGGGKPKLSPVKKKR